MNGSVKENKSFIVKVLIAIALVLIVSLFVYLFSIASGIMLLLFMSILLAVLIDGVAGLINRYLHFSRTWALLSVVVLLMVTVAGLSWLVGPRIGGQMSELIERIPEAVKEFQQGLLKTSWGKTLINNAPSAKEIIPSGPDMIGYMTGFFSSTLTILSNVIIMFFIGIYLAVDPELYINNLLYLLPESKRGKVRQIFHYCGRALKWWFLGRFASMTLVGVLTGIGLWIIGLNLALSLAIVAGLFSFIPFLGPLLSFVPAFVIAFAQDATLSYYVVAVYVVVQTVESYFLTPLIDQRTVSIPPALLITMQLLMGYLFGALGVILASPAIVIAVIFIQTFYIKGILGNKVAIMGNQKKKPRNKNSRSKNLPSN